MKFFFSVLSLLIITAIPAERTVQPISGVFFRQWLARLRLAVLYLPLKYPPRGCAAFSVGTAETSLSLPDHSSMIHHQWKKECKKWQKPKAIK